MPSIDRARETRVLAHLVRAAGISTRDALDAVDRIESDDDTWTQLRLWLAYTSDDREVAARFEVRVGRPREVVSAWGGITQDLELRMRTGERLVVERAEADDVEAGHLCDNECGDDSHPRDGRVHP